VRASGCSRKRGNEGVSEEKGGERKNRSDCLFRAVSKIPLLQLSILAICIACLLATSMEVSWLSWDSMRVESILHSLRISS